MPLGKLKNRKKTSEASTKVEKDEVVIKENTEEVPELSLEPTNSSATAVGEVSVLIGITKNLGDYNFARFEVSVSAPYAEGGKDEAYSNAVEWCDARVNELVSDLG